MIGKLHKVTCSNCGTTWEDSHPDATTGPVEIWCGECKRPNQNSLWTAQERETVLSGLIENEGSPAIIPADQLDRAVTTVAALIQALRAEHGIAIASLGNRHASIHCRTCALLDSLK